MNNEVEVGNMIFLSSIVILTGFSIAVYMVAKHTLRFYRKKQSIVKLKKLEDVDILTFDRDGIPILIKEKNGIRYL